MIIKDLAAMAAAVMAGPMWRVVQCFGDAAPDELSAHGDLAAALAELAAVQAEGCRGDFQVMSRFELVRAAIEARQG